MLNGDSITGASDIRTVTIETEWGTAKINGENLASMLFVPGLQWQSIAGLNGNRWSLIEAKVKPVGPSANGPSANGIGANGFGANGAAANANLRAGGPAAGGNAMNNPNANAANTAGNSVSVPSSMLPNPLNGVVPAVGQQLSGAAGAVQGATYGGPDALPRVVFPR